MLLCRISAHNGSPIVAVPVISLSALFFIPATVRAYPCRMKFLVYRPNNRMLEKIPCTTVRLVLSISACRQATAPVTLILERYHNFTTNRKVLKCSTGIMCSSQGRCHRSQDRPTGCPDCLAQGNFYLIRHGHTSEISTISI